MALKDAKKCHATAKGTGEQCKNPAVIGYKVCRMHGAGSPNKGRVGGYHKNKLPGKFSNMPAHLLATYERSLNDPDQLTNKNEIAAFDARTDELFKALGDEETRVLWRDIRKLWAELRRAIADGNTLKQGQLMSQIQALIHRGNKLYDSWDEIYQVAEQRRKLVESENKRLIQARQMTASEQVILLLGAVLKIITRRVLDDELRQTVLYEIKQLIDGEIIED